MADPTSDTAEFIPDCWRVAVFAIPDDRDALKEILITEFDLNPIDAQIEIHNLPGLLRERLNWDKAERVCSRIERLGVASTMIDTRTLPNLNHPKHPHHVRCSDDGMEILGIDGGRKQLIAWKDMALVSIGYVPIESSHHYSTSPEPVFSSAPHHHSMTSEMPTAHGAEMWLLTDDDLPVAYRIDHNQMNYEYLGSRKVDSATSNFQLLVGDILGMSEACYQTPATRAFVSHGPLKHFAFDSSDELQHYTLFHFLMRQKMLGSGPA